jgi:hypothetical protein
MISVISTDENNNDFAFLVREGWVQKIPYWYILLTAITIVGVETPPSKLLLLAEVI